MRARARATLSGIVAIASGLGIVALLACARADDRVPLLRSPDLMLSARSMGDYLRERSPLPKRVAELATLVVCREWTQQLEWQIHYPLALAAGLPREAADAIADGRRPDELRPDEQAAYDLSIEILRNHRVSEATYRRALAAFGEQGVVDLLGVNGYYAFLAVVMNAARTPPSPGTAVRLRAFPD